MTTLRILGVAAGVAALTWLTYAQRSPLVPLLATGGFALSRYLRTA